MPDRREQAAELERLHEAAQILVLANVWDVASARAVAAVPGVTALATASYAVAAAHGYADGEQIPLDLHLAAIARIAAASDLPVTADLESGYGDPGETTRRAIAAGAVGANLEDGLRPLGTAVAAVEAVVAAREAEGTGFVLNARTDAVWLAPDGAPAADALDDAITRGRAYLEAGAQCIFVPGVSDRAAIATLVDGLGRRRVSVLAGPGGPSISELEGLGVARASIGPFGQHLGLSALAHVAAVMLAGGTVPDGVPAHAD